VWVRVKVHQVGLCAGSDGVLEKGGAKSSVMEEKGENGSKLEERPWAAVDKSQELRKRIEGAPALFTKVRGLRTPRQ